MIVTLILAAVIIIGVVGGIAYLVTNFNFRGPWTGGN